MKVVAGTYEKHGGPVQGGSTDPVYWDVALESGQNLRPRRSKTRPSTSIRSKAASKSPTACSRRTRAACSAPGDTVEVKAGADGARFLVLAAKPIREPIVQYGPFVMNTREEIEQAIRDYQSGALTQA